MQGITKRVAWHNVVRNVSFHDGVNSSDGREKGDVGNQGKRLLFGGVIPLAQLFDDSGACHKIIMMSLIVPLVACPGTPRYHVWRGTHFVIKTRDCGLYVHSFTHVLTKVACSVRP